MLFRFLQHLVMRRGFPFVIVRLTVILPHRMILKLVPHQDSSQIRMTLEANADYVDWGGTASRRMNEWVTVDALAVLRAAGRLES